MDLFPHFNAEQKTHKRIEEVVPFESSQVPKIATFERVFPT